MATGGIDGLEEGRVIAALALNDLMTYRPRTYRSAWEAAYARLSDLQSERRPLIASVD